MQAKLGPLLLFSTVSLPDSEMGALSESIVKRQSQISFKIDYFRVPN